MHIKMEVLYIQLLVETHTHTNKGQKEDYNIANKDKLPINGIKDQDGYWKQSRKVAPNTKNVIFKVVHSSWMAYSDYVNWSLGQIS